MICRYGLYIWSILLQDKVELTISPESIRIDVVNQLGVRSQSSKIYVRVAIIQDHTTDCNHPKYIQLGVRSQLDLCTSFADCEVSKEVRSSFIKYKDSENEIAQLYDTLYFFFFVFLFFSAFNVFHKESRDLQHEYGNLQIHIQRFFNFSQLIFLAFIA